VADECLDILKNKGSGTTLVEDSNNVKEEGTANILKASAISNDAEGLTRKPSKEQVVFWHVRRHNLTNVTYRPQTEVRLICATALRINVRGKHTPQIKARLRGDRACGNMKPTDAAEQVNEPEGGRVR